MYSMQWLSILNTFEIVTVLRSSSFRWFIHLLFLPPLQNGNLYNMENMSITILFSSSSSSLFFLFIYNIPRIVFWFYYYCFIPQNTIHTVDYNPPLFFSFIVLRMTTYTIPCMYHIFSYKLDT